MRWLLLLSGFGIISGLAAQSPADSLLKLLGYPSGDTTSILSLYDRAYEIELTDPQTALDLYLSGVKWSRSIDYENGTGKGYNYAGIVKFNLGEVDSALSYAQLSLPHFKKSGNRRGYAASLNNIGNAYNLKNNYPEAIRYYQEANEVFESLGAETNIISNLNNIGNLLLRSGNPGRAEGYLLDALEGAKAIGFITGLADVNNNLGSLEESRERFGEALQYCRESLRYYRELGEVNFIVQAEGNVGRCYVQLKDYDKALVHLQRGLSMLDTLDLPREKINVLTNLSQVYNARKEYSEAVESARAALPEAKNLGDLVAEKQLTEALAQAYDGLEAPVEALSYYRQLQGINRQLYNVERNRQLLEMEQKYESEKKERQILEQLLALERSQARNRLQIAFFGIFILGALLIILWLRGRLRMNKQLTAQQAELQTQRIREMEQQQQILALDATLRGQEEERNRIARDLHDGLGGLLASLKMHINALLRNSENNDVLPITHKTDQLIDQASLEVRRIAHNMTPTALLQDGLLAVIEEMAEGLRQGQKMEVIVQTIGQLDRLPENYEVMLYRIVQELVQNIIKHAQASKVIIQIHRRDHELNLLVEDDGTGFETKDTDAGIGLQSIAARVRYLRGELDIDAVPGEGTTIVITIPIPGTNPPSS